MKIHSNLIFLLLFSCATPLFNQAILAMHPFSKATTADQTLFQPQPDTIPNMIFVLGGVLKMGSEDAAKEEKPAVPVSDFYIGKYEVTVGEYLLFADATKAHYPEWLEKDNEVNVETGTKPVYKNSGYSRSASNLPVTGVSWDDAVAYCAWLTAQNPGTTYRLPTEAEWQYAARGGHQDDGYTYAGSNNLDEVAWHAGNSDLKPHAVGTKKANKLGLYDMSGNVLEWCSDWYDTHSAGAAPSDDRVTHGGSCSNGERYCRVSRRGGYAPTFRYNILGFRMAANHLAQAADLSDGLQPVPNSPATPVKTIASDSTSPLMIFVQGGVFQMGSPDGAKEEKPVHTETVGDFYIGKYEVTQAEWRAVIGSNPKAYNFIECDQCPVECVSWDDVQEFLQKINAQTGQHYRLPTEAEWEYAARGGNQSKGYQYAGSNNLDEVAWNFANAEEKPHAVGQKKANELGIYDLSGNVVEWCSDESDLTSSCKPTNQKETGPNALRIYRGGHYLAYLLPCRVSFRCGARPTERENVVGFRLALSPQ